MSLFGRIPDGDGGLGILEVEAGVDLLGGLIDRVLDFLEIDLADDVEAVIGCHVLLFPRG